MMEFGFKQVCVWEDVTLGNSSPKEFEDWFLRELGFRIKFIEEVETLPTIKNGKKVKGTGGRHDLFFYIHSGDISKFATARFAIGGIRWWEDIFFNHQQNIYPQAIKDKCPRTW